MFTVLSHGKRLDNTQAVYQIFFFVWYNAIHAFTRAISRCSADRQCFLWGWALWMMLCHFRPFSRFRSDVLAQQLPHFFFFVNPRIYNPLVEIFRVRISSRTLVVLIGVMWLSTVLRGKQWGTDKWAWPFINACFLIHHSQSSFYLSTL